ncbi:MurR/RpiR family transcriptional regulator [Domibacillus sp. DTU_2020_1001157_1_SI_ALB_TIR_016]|uniref:MurR/RpiR family transcriptional regulator n=1 Tax=Domibacillus sp. DTU_2020_1001157_1_SI_ALB_TIR_016 TaxID=3077789 RepID=UPI0028E425CD|nr:MurR/RpiR family transcriptional regulator [Domibacillus sp. DTU_2020_1001157_1_SI_ALB_TIR_016]WNS80964.1 MurR/RpiR family transcriptional regulator [Domibacillus sp. DTU_2020_1001157_1_SI_ALB_TIR_016]
MTTGGLNRLRSILPQLPPSEKKVAQFILEQPEKLLHATASEISQMAGSSSAAVIRLCKSMGVKGFQELKVRVAGDLVKVPETGYRDIESGETLAGITQKTLSNGIQSLTDTAELMDYGQMEAAVEALAGAKTVHCFGIGASSLIAMDAQQKLLRIHKNATAFTDTHLVASLIANAEADDVLLGISFSGETQEVARLLSLAQKRGVKTISLTKYGSSAAASLADINLFTSASSEAPLRSAATASRFAQLFVIDVLFMGVATKEFDQTVQYIDRSREAISFLKESK